MRGMSRRKRVSAYLGASACYGRERDARADFARTEIRRPDEALSVVLDENIAAAAGGSAGLPGTEYASAQRYRGMHGSFSPRDVNDTLIAVGPHFESGLKDELPTSSVDLAPTIAALLDAVLASADGRVLREPQVGETGHDDYAVQASERSSKVIALPRTCRPDDPSYCHSAPAVAYGVTLQRKILTLKSAGRTFTYFDRASVTRRPL